MIGQSLGERIDIYRGSLEKKARGRGFLGSLNWKVRDFTLEGQRLSYYDPSSRKLLGGVITTDCEVARLKPDAADNKPFGFVVKTKKIEGSSDKAEEFLLNAGTEVERSKWMTFIHASSTSAKWKVASKTVSKKSGHDISNILLSKKKDGKDDKAIDIIEALQSNFKQKRFAAEIAVIDEEIRKVGSNAKVKAQFEELRYETLLKKSACFLQVRKPTFNRQFETYGYLYLYIIVISDSVESCIGKPLTSSTT